MGAEFHIRWRSCGIGPGEKNRNHKLTNALIYSIRDEYDAGQRGKERCKVYGITPSHYNAIGRRQKWGHLE